MNLSQEAWILVGLLALSTLVFAVLWWRSRSALATVARSFSKASDDANAEVEVPTDGALATHGPVFQRALRSLRGARVHATLHEQALSTLRAETVLEASTREAKAMLAADGIECASVTCVRFIDGAAHSHSRLPDDTQDLVMLRLEETPRLATEGGGGRRWSEPDQLPAFLANLAPLLGAGEASRSIAHLDALPLTPPRDSGRSSGELIGVLTVGRKEATAPVLRVDRDRSLAVLTRSLSLALDTCERVLDAASKADDAHTALARAADATSSYTRGHSERVARLAVRLGASLGLLPSDLDRLRRAALVHDLGIVAVPMRLLDQREAYDEEERAMMRPHIGYGVEILEPLDTFSDVLPVVAQHHEWWDGGGYPAGLAGEDIDPLARILTVVDVYEALTSSRPYRKGFPPEKALRHLEDRAGAQFEPRVVEALAADVRKTL